MTHAFRRLPAAFLALATLLLPIGVGIAQQTARPTAQQAPGWLYKGSDITPDPDWRFGELPNGLRYAVRRNGVPPGQVAVRVRIDAGSLYEDESERGFAHLIEHLSFRGSAYVPDGEAKRVWQRLGTTFGSDTNAVTSPVSTTYKLDLPGATEAGLDESLKILSGMVSQPNITDQALNAERPVVLAEQREAPGPQVRFSDAVRETLFAGQPLADRSPIGTIKTLQAATADKVLAFHDRWYRPERAVVILSGDVDPALMERLVTKNFSSWRGKGDNPPDPDFGKPDPSKPITRATAETAIPPLVQVGFMRPWVFNADTVLFNQKRMVDVIALRLISRRLEQRARSGGSFIEANVAIDDIQRSANATVISVVPTTDWVAALKDVRAVIADAEATLPDQAEIDREVAEYDTLLRTQVETARAEAGAKQADDLGSALDIRETVTTPETAYQILQGAKQANFFTPQAIQASTRRVMQGALRAIVNTRTPDPAAATKLTQALKADVSKLGTKRGPLVKADWSQLPALPAPGKVVARQALSDLGMEQVTFANGARLMLFANNAEAGRVYVRVRFGGGYNALPADKPAPLWAAPLALVQAGIGTLDQEALDQLTNGRRIGLDFAIDDDAFVLGATTSPQDLADQLRLIALKLYAPRWDAAPFERAKAATLLGYDGYKSSPQGVLGHDLEGLLRAGDQRWATPSRAAIQAATPAQFRAFWEPLLKTGPVELQIFGDVRAEEAIAAAAQTIGALPSRGDTLEPPTSPKFAAHVTRPVTRTHTGPDNQAVAVIAWPTGGGVGGISESRRLDLIAQIFTDRLFERLRQDAGASYSPNVQSSWPVGLASGGRILGIGQVPPDKLDFFFKLSREIAADLAANPIGQDELQRTIGPYRQLISRIATGNTFWFTNLEWATYDPRRIEALRGFSRDLAGVTPEALRDTAKKYLKPESEWTFAVLPQTARAANDNRPARPAGRAKRR
ncbi:MAG: insulinase family protein [Sphingomonas sp.]|uniref:M16 family metallopeptidase n=1 Tax=Sphingomonas sp. TaxID=28214 RepID=UPI0025E228C9|nr:M16 family metallopeptidase [Sphingomonas sp.]MBX9882205.1 insulinase family protein [Sphingomonas sp.]